MNHNAPVASLLWAFGSWHSKDRTLWGKATPHCAAVDADGAAGAGMRLLGSEILSASFRADFKTGRVSAELLDSSGGNVLLLQLVSPFNLFLRQDS